MVKTMRIKLKGGIILPDHLDKKEIERVNEKTREAIVSGIQSQKLNSRLADDNTDLSQLLAELGDADETKNKSSKLDKAIFTQNKRTQKELTSKQEAVLQKIETAIEGDKKGSIGLKQMITDAFATGKTDIQALSQLMADLGMKADDTKQLLSVLSIMSSSKNRQRVDMLSDLRKKEPQLKALNDPQIMTTLVDDVDMKNVASKQVKDLFELALFLDGKPEEEQIFGKPDPKAIKYWKFKLDYLPKLEAIDVKKTKAKSELTKLKPLLTDKKQKKKDLEDAIPKKKSDIATKKSGLETDRLKGRNYASNRNQETISKIEALIKMLSDVSPDLARVMKGINAIDKKPLIDEANKILEPINNFIRSTVLDKLVGEISYVMVKNGKQRLVRILHDGNNYTITEFINMVNGILTVRQRNMFKLDEQVFDDELNNLTAEELAFLQDPANNPLQVDPDIMQFEKDIQGFEGEEKQAEAEETNELQQGFGLRRKRKGKISKLDNITLDDISKAVHDQIKKKRADKRRNGNNKYHHFQKRAGGKFTGGILDSPDDIEKKVMEIVGTGNILQAVRMMEASKDIFTKSQYDNIMQKVLKVY